MLVLSENFLKYKIWGWKFPFWEDAGGNYEHPYLPHSNSDGCKLMRGDSPVVSLQLSVGKLPPTFFIHNAAATTRLSEPFATGTALIAKHVFHCSAPATWNSLPRTVTDSNSLGTFKSRLKTSLFSLAYNWYWHDPPPAPLKLRPNEAIQIYYFIVIITWHTRLKELT